MWQMAGKLVADGRKASRTTLQKSPLHLWQPLTYSQDLCVRNSDLETLGPALGAGKGMFLRKKSAVEFCPTLM